MKDTKLCLGIPLVGGSVEEEITLVRESGFEAFFTGWNMGENLKGYRMAGDAVGMEYQSVHAPYIHSALMWQTGEKAVRAVAELIACLEATAEAEVPIMVAHAFIGFEEHAPSQIGVENYGKVLRRAEELGVKLALENTEGEEYLDYLFCHLGDSPALGFCWDSGHEMCYNRHRDLLKDYGNKLIATHLNDNLGISDYAGCKIFWTDDLHLLPFDGIADWQYNVDRLNLAGYTGTLTFELTRVSKPHRHDNDKYARMTAAEYLAEAYARACRVAMLKKKSEKR